MLFTLVEHPQYFVGDLKHFFVCFYVWISVSQLLIELCVYCTDKALNTKRVDRQAAHNAIVYSLSITDYTFQK